MNVAMSTVAMSAYNVLAKNGEAAPVAKLHAVVKGGLNTGIESDDFAAALTGLLELGYISIVSQDEGLVDVVDPKRRIVRWRDRTNDGWDNWTVDDAAGPQKLNEVIRVLH